MSKDAHVVDRAGWASGPWDGEPDRVEWKTAHGFVGLIVRQSHSGHLCGYVGVEPGHPWHSKGYDDCRVSGGDDEWPSVHGGLTYAAECFGHVCHVPEPGAPEHLWWLGFDAAHCDDVRPGDTHAPVVYSWGASEYRSVEYMRDEVERLAAQAKDAAP